MALEYASSLLILVSHFHPRVVVAFFTNVIVSNEVCDIPDVVLGKELLNVHDGIVHVLVILTRAGHGDRDDCNPLFFLLLIF